MIDRRAHILFVCIENSNRSQMAEGFARALGGEAILASSAGSRPSGEVNRRAMRFMAERDVDLSPQSSKGLDDLPQGVVWDAVVTMGCGDACPHLPALVREDWELPDPKALDDEEFREVRDEIERRVRSLLVRVGAVPTRPLPE